MNTWSGRIGVALLAAVCATAVFADAIAPGDPFAMSDAVLHSPSRVYIFGTDDLGRDLFRAIVHGARVSLVVAIATTAAAVALGVLVGSLAGYTGGLADEALMRVTEIVQVMPRFFLVLAAAAIFGTGTVYLIMILALTSWTSIARTVRSQVLSLRIVDHVSAARAAGASPGRILGHHILPLTFAPLIAQTAFAASGAILVEASVGFLGLGDPSFMTWGALLHEGQHFLRSAWWMAAFPGAALTSTVLGIHLLADAFTDLVANDRPVF